MSKFQLITSPSQHLTLVEAKDYLRVVGEEYNDDITASINAAEEFIQKETQRLLNTCTVDAFFDDFYDGLCLPLGPVTSVSYVKYYDESDQQQTLSTSNYQLDQFVNASNGKIFPKGSGFPAISTNIVNPIVVRYVGGYSTLPYGLKLAVKLATQHFFDNRSVISDRSLVVVPFGLQELIANYKVLEV